MKLIDQPIQGGRGNDIFRGQRQLGWDLLPQALRENFRGGDHLEALTKFRREGYAFGHQATNDLVDLAVAQHCGLATNLLDWTTNPLIALFFACEEASDKDGKALNGEVFVLNNPKELEEEYWVEDKWKDIEGVRLYFLHWLIQELTRQKSLFTIQAKDTRPVESVLFDDLVFPSNLAELEEPLFLEILYRVGVKRMKLLPLVDGLCSKLIWETKNRAERQFPPLTGTRVIYLRVNAESISTVQLPFGKSSGDTTPAA